MEKQETYKCEQLDEEKLPSNEKHEMSCGDSDSTLQDEEATKPLASVNWKRICIRLLKGLVVFIILCLQCAILGYLIGLTVSVSNLENEFNLKIRDLEHELRTHVNTTHCLPPNDDDVQTKSNESLSEQTRRLDSLEFMLQNLTDKVAMLKQETQTNISRVATNLSRVATDVGELGLILTNITENLSLARDDHNDQLSLINSTIASFSSQLMSFDDRINYLNSNQSAQMSDIVSLKRNVSTLTSSLSHVDGKVSRHLSSTLDYDRHIDSAQKDASAALSKTRANSDKIKELERNANTGDLSCPIELVTLACLGLFVSTFSLH